MLVDTVAVIRCRVVTVALKALVDILPTVKLATTAAIKVDHPTYPHLTVDRATLCDVLHLFTAASSKLLATISFLVTTGVLELTSPGLECIRVQLF